MRIKELMYRMRLRKELKQASIEELRITKEETINEINRRNKKNGNWTITKNFTSI